MLRRREAMIARANGKLTELLRDAGEAAHDDAWGRRARRIALARALDDLSSPGLGCVHTERPWAVALRFDHHRCDFERVAPWRMACLRKAWDGFSQRATEVCRNDLCVPYDRTCRTSNDCRGDTRCDSQTGMCIPYDQSFPFDPACVGSPEPGVFVTEKLRCLGEHHHGE